MWRAMRQASLSSAICLMGQGVWAQGATTPPAAAPVRPSAGAATAPRLRALEVTVNQAKVGEWTLLERDGALYAQADAFKEWRLLPPPAEQALDFRGQKWLPLFALPGYRARFDYEHQAMELEFAAGAFAATQLKDEGPRALELTPKTPSAFANYDLSSTWVMARNAAMARDTGLLSELGLAWGPGTLVSSLVGRNLGSADPARPAEWRRLETTWTRDFPERQLTLRLGDTSTPTPIWGRSVYYGGVQLASNFGLMPGFISQPIPTLAGSAAGPSTVELYINNALRQTSNVPAGPFTIENFTGLTGGGQVRMVVRDTLGRETVVERSFFAGGGMLEQGLSEWNLNAGRLRFNLGTLNADYGEAFASGLYRRGLSKSLTLEGRLEHSASVSSAGLGATAALPWQTLGQFALAASRTDATGAGGKWLLAFDQQSLDSGVGVRWQGATEAYREIGFGATELPLRREFSINARRNLGESGAITFSAAQASPWNSGATRSLGLGYATRVFERASLSVNATRVAGTASGTAVSVSMTLPLEGARTSSASISRSPSGAIDGYASATQPVVGEIGTGWRVLGGQRGGQAFAEGGVYRQGSLAYLGADLSANADVQTLRLTAQGALVAMDGGLFPTRRVSDGYALVEVKGYPNVGVGFQGRMLARTNQNGQALVPGLAAYQGNAIRLDPNDLPFSAEIDSIEQTVVPAWRSGVKVAFPVRSGRGALLRIVLDDGQPAPAGAEVKVAGDSKEFFVARRGEAYVTGLQDRSTVQLAWKGKRCDIAVLLPPSQPDDVPRVGPLECKGVLR